MKWIDLVHRWTGGLIGLLLALLGLSGAILVHRRAWVMLPHAGDPQIQDTGRVASVTAKLMTDAAHRPSNLIFAERDFGLDRVSYKGGAGAYLDQAGHGIARWSSEWARPELWLFDFHHHLFAGDIGETVIGVAGLAGLGFVGTGAILWWRTRKTFAFRLWPKRLSRPSIVRHHRDLGIVAAPLLLLSFLTGVVLVFRPLAPLLLGPGAAQAIRQASAPPKAPVVSVGEHLDWAGMIVAARARFPDAEVRSLALPRGHSGLITVRMRQPEEWLRGGRTMIWFAADTGRIVGARDSREASAQAKAYGLLFPLHAADVGGLAFRVVMTLSGLSLTLLGTLAMWTFWFRRSQRPKRN